MRSVPRRARAIVLVGLAYVVGARVGLHLAIDNPNVTAVWPPTGIAVAALWSVGLEVWPAIAAGALVANLTNGASLATSLAITPGNVLAPLVAWTLLRRLHFDSRLSSVGDVVKLVGIGAFASMLVSATLGTVALIVTGALGTSAAWSVWMTWWLGDASGVVLFAPAVLVLAGAGGRMRELIGRPFETVLWLALTSGVTLALAATSVPILFIAIPVVAGGALRFRQQGAAIAIALVAAISTWATASGLGPYQQMSTTTKLLLLQAFNGTLALLSLLVAAVVTERIAAQDAVQRIADDFRRRALEDPLTGLANRALLIDRVEHALVRREPPMLTILFVDLDDFKSVNDTVGHAAGDQLLVEVAQRLRPCVRPEDTVGRLGGDEFAILLEGSGDALDAEAVADRVRAVLRAPFAVQGARVHIGASIGIAAANADTTSADEVLSRADLALYRAKAGAKGSVEVYEPSMRAEMRERQEIRADLARALLHDELLVQYQPIVALRTREVVGAEALVRRRHPRRGLIPPASFIPVAEQSGMIAALGRRVLECACAQAAEWQRSSPWAPPLAMTVNVSPRQLQERHTVLDILDVIMASELDPRSLVLEIGEACLTDDGAAVLERFRALGIRIAIDDFGTGSSTLGSLHTPPVDIVKIDGALLRGDDTALTVGIVRLLGALGVATIAEGIERPDQLAMLSEAGCEQGQGFLFSHPVDAGAFEVVRSTSRREAVLSGS